MYIFKIVLAGLICSGLCLTPLPKAQAEERELVNISGSFSDVFEFLTDSIGIDPGSEQPEFQETFDPSQNSKIYLNVRGTKVESKDDGDADESEINLVFGYIREMNGVLINVGGLYYSYPSDINDLPYTLLEYEFGLSYEFPFVEMFGTFYYTPNFFEGTGNTANVSYDVEVPLLKNFAMTGHVAYQWMDDQTMQDASNYMDWSTGLIYPLNDFDLRLQYENTDLSAEECVEGCGSIISLNLTRSF